MLHQKINIDSELSKAKKFTKIGKKNLAKEVYDNILIKFPNNIRAKNGLENLDKSSIKSFPNNLKIKQKLDEIVQLYNHKKFEEAYEMALYLYTFENKNYLLCNILGAINSMLMDTDQAQYYYKKAIEINPSYDGAYSNLATCYRGMGNYELAIETYNQAIEINPLNSEAYNNLGLVFKDIGKIDEAIENYSKSLEINENNVLALNNLGLAYRNLKNNDKAIEFFNKSIVIQKNYFEAYVNRGSSHIDEGNFELAIQDLEKAIEISPDCAQAYNNLGSAHTEMGKPDLALTYLKKAIDIDPDYSEAYNNMGIASEFNNNHENSIIYFQKSLELDANNHNARIFLSYLNFTNENYEKFQIGYKSRLYKKGDLNHKELKIADSYAESLDLKNKKIIAYDEQGIGDEINFVGLLDLFKEKISKNITLVCSDRLVDIYKNSFPDTPVFNRKEIAEGSQTYDCEMPIGSFLEYIDLKDKINLPLKPYIKPSSYLTSFWDKQLQSLCLGKKIGIAWRGGITAGQKLKRSISLIDLMRSLPLEGNYVSLQYGDCEDEINNAEQLTGRKIIHFSDIDPTKELNNQFSIMSNMDHIITIQSSTVHFAGAMGVPVTALLSVSPDFRYENFGTKSKFYQSVEYIRQDKIGEWSNVLENVNLKFNSYFSD